MSLLGPEKEKAGEVRVDPALMKLLTSDTRRNVLRRLGKRRMNLTELARDVGLKKATVLEHLRRLEEAELVTRKEDDRLWVYYELTPTARSLVDPVGTRIMLVLGVTIAALAVVATMFVFANAQLGLWGTTPDDPGPGTLGVSLHGFHDTHVGSGVDIQGAWSEADPEHGPFTAYLLDDEARSALLAGEPWRPQAGLIATAHPDGLQVHGDPAVDPGDYWLYIQDAHNNDNRNEMPLLQLRLPPVELTHTQWWRGLDDTVTVSLPATAGDGAPQIALFAAHQDPEREVWESEDSTVRLPPEALDNKSAGTYELHYRAAGSDRWVFLNQTLEIHVPKFDVVPHTLVEGSGRELNVFISASGDARPDAINITLDGEHMLMERATPGRGVLALDRVDPGQLQVQIGRLANTTVPVIPDLDVAITLQDGPELNFQIKNATGEPKRDVQVRLDQEILGTTDHQGELRVAPPLAQGDSRLVFKTDSGHELPWRVNVDGWDLHVRPQQVHLVTGSPDRPILRVDIENPDPWPINTTLVGSKDGSIYAATAIHLQGGQWSTLELPVAEVDLNATKYHVHAEGPALKQPSYRNQTSQQEPQPAPSPPPTPATPPADPADDEADYETDDAPTAFFGEIISTLREPEPIPQPVDPTDPTDTTDPLEPHPEGPEQEAPALPVLLILLGALLVLLWARGRPPRPRGSSAGGSPPTEQIPDPYLILRVPHPHATEPARDPPDTHRQQNHLRTAHHQTPGVHPSGNDQTTRPSVVNPMECQKPQGFPRPPRNLQSAFLFVVLLTAAMAPLAAASPMPVPPSSSDSLILDSLEVSVAITDALAVTQLNASFENPSNLTQESHVAFTLSPTAVITGFRLTVDNETFVGVVKEKQQAQAEYDDAVERDEHAVLVTSAGDGRLAFTMNVPANTTATVQAEFAEILPLHHGAQEYAFPLDRIGGQYGPVGDIRVDLKATTSGGWAASTASGLDFETMESAGDTVAYRFHAQDHQPERELRFRLTPHATEYASGGIISGYEENATAVFTILPPGQGETAIPKDVVLIMDVSGSMNRDNKIEQARDAMIEILHQLRPGDRFALITFATEVDVHYQGLQHPTGDPFQDALAWVNAMEAGGWTNISGSLDEALKILAGDTEEAARLPVVVLVTDGEANRGISDQGEIVKAVDDWNTMGARVHTVGIGFRHDYAFLNELARENQGFYQGMPWDADASEILADFLDRVGTPVLKDVTVTLPGLQARDAHPQPLPDLYAGSHLVYAARIDTTNLSGTQEIRIQGHTHEGPRTLELTLDADTIRVVPEAEQLWARQKAATLEYRLELYRGSEDAEAQRDQLRTLGVTHQIATTETSWIVVAESGLIDPLSETAPESPTGGGGGAPAPPTADYDYADPVDPTMPTTPTDPGHPVGAYNRGEQDDAAQHGDEQETPAPAFLVLLAVLGLLVLASQRRRAA